MRVLVLGRNAAMMSSVLKMLSDASYDATGVLTDAEAIEKLRLDSFDVIAVGGGVETESRQTIKSVAEETGTRVLEVYGPQTLLPSLAELSGE